MARFRIFLYKLYKSELLFFAGIILFIPQGILLTYVLSYLMLISHIALGMYFKRKTLLPYQYGIRIGLIIAMTADLIFKVCT